METDKPETIGHARPPGRNTDTENLENNQQGETK